MKRRQFLKNSSVGLLGSGLLMETTIQANYPKAELKMPKIKAFHKLGRTGFMASDIGIGASRMFDLPILNTLLDAGVNYIDTAESYGRGMSETNIGNAIKGRERSKLFITTKIHIQQGDTKATLLEKFAKCLERLQTPYVDCLMIHSPATVAVLKDKGFHQATDQLKKENKIRFVGVSSHGPRFQSEEDSMEKVLLAAIDDGRFDVLLLIYNFIQKDSGEKIIKAAKAKNIAATIMKSNPIGRYYTIKDQIDQLKKESKAVDERMQTQFDRLQESFRLAEPFLKENKLSDPREINQAALKFVLNNPDVHVLNLAFQNFDDIEHYLQLSGNTITEKDKKTLALYQQAFGTFYCRHACGLCESKCPKKLPINTIMRYHHYFEVGGSEKYAMEKYARLQTNPDNQCQNCQGTCETACPYQVPIKGLLSLAHSHLRLG